MYILGNYMLRIDDRLSSFELNSLALEPFKHKNGAF